MEKRSSEPYIASYLHSRGRALGLPVSGSFELTARCNFSCPMCYVHQCSCRPEQELTAAQWIDLARQARDEGMVFALLTGGEPLIRKDFFEIYGEMKKMGLMVSINSNGSLLSGEVRRRLLEDPPIRMNISLYGGCRETYRNMCGQDAFETVVENIRALHEGGIALRLNLSITPYNRQDISKIMEISRQLGIHVQASGYMYPPMRLGNEAGDRRLSAEDAAACTVQWDRLRMPPEEFARRAEAMEQLTAVDMPECPMESETGIGCRAGSSSFWLTWEGKMTPCGMMPSPAAYPLRTGLRAAWQEILRQTRELRTPDKCSSCPKRELCSVCAAVCLTETGRFDGVPEYMCRMTDSIVEETCRAARQGKEQQHGN